ncbi:hypothetical protein J3998_12000 [Thiomicrorhabdus sp. 6S2-11]|uniref:CheB-type methylesterase domain-containing protein n=1 Tax=Thiomicrorhabdus marina TaxID=2818442 RepID=A0ABS3Q7R7_9GAMM|nr:hypothetical protein [Thiomicrorhabdus marina]MBO1928296.1 hypothetical protein [Thiomicrorhabdus marina]
MSDNENEQTSKNSELASTPSTHSDTEKAISDSDSIETYSNDIEALNEDLERQSNPLVVVGIGSSAGGLEALQVLVSGLPVDSGMSFILA